MRDKYSDEKPEIALKVKARTASGNGEFIIDLKGFFGVLIAVVAGVITDGTSYEFELKHGEQANLSDAAAVPDEDLLGSEPTFLQASDGDSVKYFGYIGTKRYLRVDLKTVVGSPSTGGIFGALTIKGLPRHKPTN